MDLTTVVDSILGFFLDMATWLLDGILFIIRGFFYVLMDGFLVVITTFFNALDIGSHLVSLSSYFGMLPPQMVYVINAVGIPQGLSIIAWAVGIRMLINLIPAEFTRL